MNDELLTTFDEYGNITGAALRDEVHRLGLWHETFHCWFVSKEQENINIYLQLRSGQKKDYASLLDITAAGHLLSHEVPADGIREVQEELGIGVKFDQLISLGIIPYCMDKEGFLDRERAHVFLYAYNSSLSDFNLQQEEVAGIVTVDFADFRNLWLGNLDKLRIQGFKVDNSGSRVPIDRFVDSSHFVPHEIKYYQRIIEGIEAVFG